MRTVIKYTNYYIPENFIPIEEYVEKLDDSSLLAVDCNMKKNDLVVILKNTMGIRKVYIEDRKNETKIFGKMLERYFNSASTTPGEIDFIIYTRGNSVSAGNPWSVTEEECINVPYFLQKEYKMSRAQVFSIEQDVSGTLIAARIAFSLINSGSVGKVLLLSRNFFQKPENRLMWGTSLVSDGLGLMEISTGGTGLVIIDCAGAADGGICRIKDFGKNVNQEKVIQTGSNLIKNLIGKNNLTMKDISRIIPQNTSKSVWNFYSQLLDFPKEKVFLDNFSDGGHMGDVDIIRNITDIRERKLLAPQEFAIAYGIGTGTSWNALLLQAL
jgi:3-oxoacyl-[acyl-carrier-protein] synthase-3